MKFITSLALIIIASVNLANSKRVHTKTKSNFGSTCNKVKLAGTNLSAVCERRDKTWMKTSVNLSSCVTNNNGQLKRGGAYDRSCRSCKLSGTTLSCQCKNMRGSWKNSAFNLNTFIGNTDGSFAGCGHATSTPIPAKTSGNVGGSTSGNTGSGSGSSSGSSSSSGSNTAADISKQDLERNLNTK